MKLVKTVLATFCFLLSLALCATSVLAADFNETQKLAEQGDARAQFNLAVSYYNGDGVPQDKQKAVEWYRKAAEQGHATAQFNLAIMYKKGEGVPQDKKKAVEWYQKAAEQGFASAQYSLGIMYYNGEGVPQGKKKAVEWLQKAAEQGHAHAQFELGDMYEKGDGVEQNLATAEEWYSKACAKGSEKACKAVKRVSKKSGWGVEQNFKMWALLLFIVAGIYILKKLKEKRFSSIPEDFKYIYAHEALVGIDFIAIDLRNQKMRLALSSIGKTYDFADIQRHEKVRGNTPRKIRRIRGKHICMCDLIFHVNDPKNPTWKFEGVEDEIDCAEFLVSRALDGTLPDTDERRIIDGPVSAKKFMSFLSTGAGAQG